MDGLGELERAIRASDRAEQDALVADAFIAEAWASLAALPARQSERRLPGSFRSIGL